MTDTHSSRASALRRQVVGFGCATIYRLPTRKDRERILATAYDLGIRHFDVAPMYGLGRAEAELGDFARSRSEVEVATKFGIRLTPVGRAAGLVQQPIRRALRYSSATQARAQQSGSGPDSGITGKLLYSRKQLSPACARRALESSLRTLRTERIHCFLLHDPIASHIGNVDELADYLDAEQRRGVIGSWGPAGDPSDLGEAASPIFDRASIVQRPYSLVTGYRGPAPTGRTITFGFVARMLPRVRTVLERNDRLRAHCSALLDADLVDADNIVKLLVRDAIVHNPDGLVLLSSTTPKNLDTMCSAALTPLRNENEVVRLLRQGCVDIVDPE